MSASSGGWALAGPTLPATAAAAGSRWLTLVRESAGAATMPRDMYRPLLAYLTALSLEQTEVTLSFAELEARCGPLSATARTLRTYWTDVAHSLYWRPSGWTARLNRIA